MDKIVVGIDGSEGSKEALRWSVEEGRAHGATVVALHAWEAPFVSPDVMAAPHLDVVGVISQLHERALELVSNAVDEVVGDDTTVAVEPTPAEGPPAEVLVDAARDADLLVVGSRGLGLTELLLGSVSQHCVQHAPCPVVIHRHKASTEGA